MRFCHYCHKSDKQIPLFPYCFQEKELYVCIKCYHEYLDIDKGR